MDHDQPLSPASRPAWRQFAQVGLRDAAGVMSRPFFWGLLGAAVFVTTLAGPFGTFEQLAFPIRFFYWTVGIVFVTLLVTVLSFVAYTTSRGFGWPWPPGALVAALVAVPPHWVLVHEMDEMLLPGANDGMLELLPYVAIPVIVMTLLINAVVIKVLSISEGRQPPAPTVLPAEEEAQPHSEPSLLMQRVPLHLGRDIVCLRAQDHYLEVVTTTGSVLVLMRLSDAERALSTIPGMRVHRSWWVALDHVVEFSRADGGGVSLTTSTGHVIPVSRNQREALGAALAVRRNAAE